ncbi:hypothetical protein EXN00_16635 [Clostridium botulinum]|uniref:Conserved domain protein n=1 Tax=Clostridium botulinum (strain Kyoto / Type A2) TaxID=536232 RepID=C1FM92_CLOBJ|nr:hypothetical protein [Clostridium botulinum]ACO83885.1 conserved domain protein [Clostridium botulinum A2 str. Kyoto]AUN06628.1 hypothetical protein RSJ14_07880 [Clostridium botulinum]MBN3365644.1 hypothetical protein [Clostridium botulinum]MBN3376147.1 hypothetical protein [Clostridium botulinum]MBN3392334.1 hypothetical protein [Clostridium botulinum]
MNNMTDGKKDGLALVYVKDSVAYPVALNEEQLEILDITLGMSLKEIKLINKPIGKVINLLEK